MTRYQGGLRKLADDPYVKVPQPTVRRTSMCFRALGVLTWILDRPDGWKIDTAQMAKIDPLLPGGGQEGWDREGRDAIRKAFQVLRREGFYRVERVRLLDGTFISGCSAARVHVPRWAEQAAIFGEKNPVPLYEQPDGTLLVRYPDGQMLPDDFPAPTDIPQELLAKPMATRTVRRAAAGRARAAVRPKGTTDPSPAPGFQAPAPATENQAPVSQAPDYQAPIEEDLPEESKKRPSPPLSPLTESQVSAPLRSERGGMGEPSPDLENQKILTEAATQAVAARPPGASSWTVDQTLEAMYAAIASGRLPQAVVHEILVAARDPLTGLPSRINSAGWSFHMSRLAAAEHAAAAPPPAPPPAPPKPRVARIACEPCSHDEHGNFVKTVLHNGDCPRGHAPAPPVRSWRDLNSAGRT